MKSNKYLRTAVSNGNHATLLIPADLKPGMLVRRYDGADGPDAVLLVVWARDGLKRLVLLNDPTHTYTHCSTQDEPVFQLLPEGTSVTLTACSPSRRGS